MIVPLQFGFQFTVDIPLLVKLAPLLLILAGIASAGRLLERAFGVTPAVGSSIQVLIKAIIYLGIIIGALCIISAIQIFMTGSIFQSFLIVYLAAISGVQSVHGFAGYLLWLIFQYKYYFWIRASYTYGILLLVGFSLVVKPIKMFPWAALLALLVSGVVTVLVWQFLNITGILWLILIFVVTLIVTYLLFKFVETIFKAIATILTFPVIAIPLGIICIIQGILLLIGSTLPNLFSPPLFGLF
jgi:hypothetical protein